MPGRAAKCLLAFLGIVHCCTYREAIAAINQARLTHLIASILVQYREAGGLMANRDRGSRNSLPLLQRVRNLLSTTHCAEIL
jgi:hypothetical protein